MSIAEPEKNNLGLLLSLVGNLPKEDITYIAEGIKSIAKVMGLSKDQTRRGIKTVQQMLAKGIVTPEELRLQFMEAGFSQGLYCMVKAAQEINLVDKSLSDTDATLAFFELQRQRKVITEDILVPFIGVMREYYNLK